jgi:hypothetical protein
MLRKSFLICVVLPLVLLEVYLLAVWLIPPSHQSVLFAENGVFELGTAAFFCAAGCLALGLCVRTRGLVPNRYRAVLAMFAIAACFVTLEEISYGQHLFGLDSPEWFAQNSSKNEINLHNLYGNGISNVMRGAAGLGFPLAFLVIPLVAMVRSNAYKSGRWSYYLLPRTELVTLVLVAQSITLLENESKWILGNSLLVRPGEVQEFFWAIAAAAYTVILRHRLLPAAASEVTDDVQIFKFEKQELRRAA